MSSQMPYIVIISGVPSDKGVTCPDLQDLIEKCCGTTLRVEPWYAKSARDPRRALIVFSERKSVKAAQTLFDPPTRSQRAVRDVPIWASGFKVHTFGSEGTFWRYVEAQARDQADVKSVLDAMNDAKEKRFKAQFQRVEDQFAKVKRNLEEETQNVEKTVAQITSKPLNDKTAQLVNELKSYLAGLEIRAKAAEEKVKKSRQAIVGERAQIAKLEAELAEQQEDERRHELLQLVTKYKAKLCLSSAPSETEVVQKLLLNDIERTYGSQSLAHLSVEQLELLKAELENPALTLALVDAFSRTDESRLTPMASSHKRPKSSL